MVWLQLPAVHADALPSIPAARIHHMSEPTPTNLLAYWRACELFAPQPLQRLVGKDARVTTVDATTKVLPWHPSHPLHREHKLGAKQAWRHIVYLGVYSVDQAFGDVRKRFPADGENARELPQAGRSALAAVLVADDGRPLLASIQLASCGWAVSVALREGLDAVGRGGFDQSAWGFREELRDLLAPADDDTMASALAAKGEPVGRPVEAGDLHECVGAAAELLQLDRLHKTHHLRSAREIAIVSTRVGTRERYEGRGREFLNSFFAADLREVGEAAAKDDIGRALRSYLKPEKGPRVDVEENLKYVRRALTPNATGAGRWLSDASEQAAVGQQLALNSLEGDLHAVNGPPGTGKTTLLRDLVASVVVARAERLAELDTPEEAFGEAIGFAGRRVHPLKKTLAGHELVLACQTNAAAANVTAEIPAADAICSEWKAEHFAEIGTSLLNPPGCEPTRSAWGLIAGVLGNRANNSAFLNSFWWGGFKNVLKDEAAPSWEGAVADFRAAQEKVEALRYGLAGYADPLEEREEVQEQLATLPKVDLADLHEAESELEEYGRVTGEAETNLEHQRRLLAEHSHGRPPLWSRVLAEQVGGRLRLRRGRLAEAQSWQARDEALTRGLAEAKRKHIEATSRARAAAQRVHELTEQVRASEREREGLERQLAELDDLIPRLRENWEQRYTAPYPDTDWEAVEARERREREAPWSSEEFNRARSELFLAALAVHKAFILNAKEKMGDNLRAASELISGKANDASAKAARTVWQSLFLAVPLVSTTFASVSYLFRHLGRESLGWLLIDEAGQATPQAAVGALWRAKRAIVVGDPLQLEPIVQLPKSIEQRLRERHNIETDGVMPDPSVQRFADLASPVGTYRGDEHERVWVGIPLNVHRRCEAPMFDISNRIAYRGQMINCTPERSDLALPESHWIDVPSESAGSNWLPREGEALKDLLDGLRYRLPAVNLDFSSVFLITPFRAVATRIEHTARDYPGLTAGTIHRAQGREAEIVILILGGDPAKPGARAWAAQKPNLLNVAVSRARRRLYVIGDREAWSRLPHFVTLAAVLPISRPLHVSGRIT